MAEGQQQGDSGSSLSEERKTEPLGTSDEGAGALGEEEVDVKQCLDDAPGGSSSGASKDIASPVEEDGAAKTGGFVVNLWGFRLSQEQVKITATQARRPAMIIVIIFFSTLLIRRLIHSHYPVQQGKNVMRSVLQPGQDSELAQAILALPEPLHTPFVALAVKLGTIRYGLGAEEAAHMLPVTMQVRLALMSRDMPPPGWGRLPGGLECPPGHQKVRAGAAATGFEKVEAEYGARNAGEGCLSPKGMWLTNGVAPVVRYKFEIVAQLMGLKAGFKVLEWGAGCGHAMDIVASRYGFEAATVDLIEANAAWTRSNMNSIQHACGMDGSKLAFKQGQFDAVLSNAALVHAPGRKAQCRILRDQVLPVLRPGGCAWFGFNGFLDTDDSGQAPSPDFWARDGPCFASTWDVSVTTIQEQSLFGFSEYDRRDSYSIFMCRTRREGVASIPWAATHVLTQIREKAGKAGHNGLKKTPDWVSRVLKSVAHDQSLLQKEADDEQGAYDLKAEQDPAAL